MTRWSTYEYSGAAPARAPDFVIPLLTSAYSANQQAWTPGTHKVVVPATYFKVYAVSNVGVTIASSGNTLVFPFVADDRLLRRNDAARATLQSRISSWRALGLDQTHAAFVANRFVGLPTLSGAGYIDLRSGGRFTAVGSIYSRIDDNDSFSEILGRGFAEQWASAKPPSAKNL